MMQVSCCPMLRCGSLLLVLLVALAAPSWSQDARRAGAARELRPLPGQRILFNGDSIFKGYGFGNYTDEIEL